MDCLTLKQNGRGGSFRGESCGLKAAGSENSNKLKHIFNSNILYQSKLTFIIMLFFEMGNQMNEFNFMLKGMKCAPNCKLLCIQRKIGSVL